MLKPKQLACIEIMLANPTITVFKLADEVGVNRNTISDWRRYNQEFKDEYSRRLKEKFAESEGIAVETMRKLATDGDFKASKYILDSLGYAPTQKIDANVEGKTELTITIGEE